MTRTNRVLLLFLFAALANTDIVIAGMRRGEANADEVAQTPAETAAIVTDKNEAVSVRRRGVFVLNGSADSRRRSGHSALGSFNHRLRKPAPKKTTAADRSDSTKHKPENAGRVSAALKSREERLPTGRPIRSLPGHRERVTSVAYSPDGRWIGTAAWDGTARLWDAKTGQQVRRLDVPSTRDDNLAHLSQIMFSPDNKFIVAASLYGLSRIVIVWNRRTGEKVRAFPEGCAAFSPDGKLIACSGRNGNRGVIRLHNFATGKLVREMLGQQTDIRSLLFSPDGKTLFSTGSLPRPPRDDNLLSLGGFDPEVVRVWDVATGKERRSNLTGLRANPLILSLSPDGRTLAHNTGDPAGKKSITLRETATGGRRAELTGHTKRFTDTEVAFSPDGRTLASAGIDGTVRLWDLRSGKEVGRLEGGHPRWVLAVAFSPDGRTLVSGGLDNKVHIWDVSRIIGRRGELKERSATELDTDWRELRGDAATAYAALGRLVSSPDNGVAFLAKKLQQQTKPVDTKRIEQLIADLDAGQFRIRAQATKELGALRHLAAPALQKALAGNPSLEARGRLEALLSRLDGASLSPETVRQIRAVEALESIGNPEARRLLEKLAAGPAETRLTQEAKAAAARLAKQASVAP